MATRAGPDGVVASTLHVRLPPRALMRTATGRIVVGQGSLARLGTPGAATVTRRPPG